MNHILIALPLCLAGCSVVPDAQDPAAQPYQAEAAREVRAYNMAHGLNLSAPHVGVGAVTALAYANDWCPSGAAGSCWITLSAPYVATEPVYMLRHTTRHEVAHYLCVATVPGCTPNDHGPAWRRIAVEVGMPPDDPYLVRPETGV